MLDTLSTKKTMSSAIQSEQSELAGVLNKVLAAETELTPDQKYNLLKKLKNLFGMENTIGAMEDKDTRFKGYLSALDTALQAINSIYRNLSEDERYNDLIKKIVLRNNDNDKLMFLPVEDILKEYQLSDAAGRRIRRVTKTIVLSMLSPTEKLRFVYSTFPFFSKIKRLLLEERESGKRQYKYIIDKKHLENDAFLVDNLDDAAEKNNYQLIFNDNALCLLNALVAMEIGYKDFNNTSKKWFQDDSAFEPIDRTNITLDTIFRIAFAFRLSIERFEYLCEGSVNSVWDALDAAQDIMRFGLHFKVPYDITIQYAGYYANHRQPSNDMASQLDARDEINAFFDKYDAQDYAQNGSRIQSEFYDLLDHLGAEIAVTDSKRMTRSVHFAWRKNPDNLAFDRKSVAAEYVKKTIDLLNRDTIQSIVDQIPDTKYGDVYDKRIEEAQTLFDELFPDDQATVNIDSLLNISNVDNLDSYNYKNGKSTFLAKLCDGKNPQTNEKKCEWIKSPLTATLINQLLSGEIYEKNAERIDRNIILRIAYLYTLVRFLIGELDNDTILPAFEQTVADMLERCMYLPLNVSLPLDLIIYESLAETEIFKPAAYQMLIPRVNKEC